MKLKRWCYVVTHWEQWHYNVKYVLLSPVWLWYSLRARSFYFFTPANPTLTFGGFEGGPKREIYNHLPKETFPNSIYIDPTWPLQQVEKGLAEAGLSYPIAVKPNIGMMGLMFRKIDNKEELSIYHQTMTAEYILQELVHYPVEVSVFYYRMPAEERGNITGFVKKEALEVVGDGSSTLGTLMQQLLNRPGFKYDEWEAKHRSRLGEIIPAGEIFRLSWVANLSRGARLVSLEEEKDDNLLQVFDRISHASGNLYYGRYDVKCASVNDLKEGKNFSILEFNGTGAEPHHMYGNGNNLFQAFKIIVHHWHILFSIARYHNRQGVKCKTLTEGLGFTRRANKHFKHLRELDKKMPVFH
ncbi:MAG: hypothetical protein ABR502_01705 [Chitinophagaceae bacterium]